MSSDAAAREYLDYYLNRPGNPDFAVMLEGPWGSGKSFFFDHYFGDRLRKARAKDPKAKDEIRITLFGVRDLSDITAQIFAKAHPMLGGKTAKFINVVGSKVASHFSFSSNPEENAKLLQEMMLNLDGRVLVFDDFERCPLPVVEVMGFINRFVEQDKVKVIVVASEDDIDAKQKDEYLSRKEKLIGKTIRVGSDPGVVLDTFIADLAEPEARAAIMANRDTVLATFNACGRPNFRSLRAILFDYDRLVGLSDPKLKTSADALATLLPYIVAAGMEYRNNGIDADGLRTLSVDLALRMIFNDTPVPKKRQRAVRLRDQYRLVSWHDPIVPPEMLAELFGSGTIDLINLNAHLLTHPRVVGRAHVPEWRAMWNWYDMSESEYLPVRDAFADQLVKRKLVHPGEILHAAGTSIRLQSYGDDVLGGLKPLAFFTAYLGDLEKADTLQAAPQLFGIGSGSHGGLVYNEHDTKTFAKIHALVRDATVRALSRRTQREVVDLLNHLKADPKDGSMLHEWGFDEKKYAGIAILHHISVSDMADLLLVDSKLNDMLLAALSRRYELAPNDDSLNPEKRWVIALHAELKRRMKAVRAPFRSVGEGRLAYWFGKLQTWATPPVKIGTTKPARGSTPTSIVPAPP